MRPKLLATKVSGGHLVPVICATPVSALRTAAGLGGHDNLPRLRAS